MSSEALSTGRERLRLAKSERLKYEANWYMNLAYFQGDQWVRFDGAGLHKLRTKRITVTANGIQPVVRTEVAKMSKQRPGWAATPTTADEKAINDATTSSRLLDWSYDKLKFSARRRDAIQWSRICGSGFIKHTWDPFCGDEGAEVLIDPEGEPVPHPSTGRPLKKGEMPEIEGLPGLTTQKIGQGDVQLVVRSPFDIYPDPLATSMDDLRWLIDESVRSPEYVKERYGVEVPPDAPAQTGIVESRFMANAASSAAGNGENIGVRVFEMWERNCPSYPEGRHVVWCEGHVLVDEANPYKRIPYTMFLGIPVPGRFQPDAIVTQLRPMQDRINKTLSQAAENISRFGNPSLLLDALADIKYSGVPGEQITFNGTTQTAMPAFLQPPSMPAYVFTVLGEFQQAMRDISGQNEVSQGTVPAGVTAAAAISMLSEQDQTRLGPDVENMEDSIGCVGQAVIELIARYYTTERIVVITGDDGITDIDAFKAGAEFHIPNVSVQPFSTFPRSIAAKQAAIRDMLNMMLQYGVPVTPEALARAMRDMQVGGLENLVESFGIDQQQIASEHADFLRGEQLVGNPMVDNHQAHSSGHRDFGKSARFRGLDPAQQELMYRHIQWHDEQIAASMASQAALQAPPVGGDPGAVPGMPPPGPGTVPTSPSGNPVASDPGGGIATAPTM